MTKLCQLSLAIITALIVSMLVTTAGASEVPLPERGATVSASTSSLQFLVSLGDEDQLGWTGLRYGFAGQSIALPIGYNRPIVTLERYRLVPRIEVAPVVLVRDDLTIAGQARLGLDSRWVGEHVGALLGGEVDGAVGFMNPFDRRTRLHGVVGFGHRFGGLEAWLTGRSGYIFGGAGAGSITYDVGLSISYSL